MIETDEPTIYAVAVWRPLASAVAVVLIAAGATGASASDPGILAGTIAYDLGDRLMLSDLDGANRRLLVRTPSGQPFADPVWSPDGTSIAFVRGGDVYVARVADRAVTRVARVPGRLTEPLLWSPDGSRLAFGWLAKNWCQARVGSRGLYVADLPGTGGRRLTSVEPAKPPARRALAFSALDWSPDGKRLLYGEERWRVPGDCGLYLGSSLVRSSLFHVGVAGGRPTRIPAGLAGHAQWSPDGQLIALCGDPSDRGGFSNESGISVARRDGRVIRAWPNLNLVYGCNPSGGPPFWIIWSRPGDEVYTAIDERVVALRVADGRQRTLLRDPGLSCTGNFPCTTFIRALSRDGRVLVVEAEGGRADASKLLALTTDGRTQHALPYPRDVGFGFDIFLP